MTRRLGVVLAVCALAATASADQAKPKKAPAAKKEKAPEAPPADDQPADGSDAIGSAGDAQPQMRPHITGPQLVDLGNNTEINLPAGMFLFEHPEAKKMVEEDGGNGESMLAIIIPADPTQSWSMYIEYDDVGYVKDSDANELDPNELFNQFKVGTDHQNERRRSLGVPEMFLDGWSEMPKYEKSTHKLAWGLKGHSTDGQVINFFTRLLGRNGYLSLNLIDAPDKIEASKVQAAGLLTAIHYKTGATYTDHKDGDKDSGMGLKALVLGGAAVAAFKVAKAGILVKFLAVAWKGIIFVIAGIGAFFKKIFGRGQKAPTDLPPDGPPVG